MDYLTLKSLHLIFVITWFAGLFYVVRLFVYEREGHERSEVEQKVLLPQYRLMVRRLWLGITWPSAFLTLLFGGLMIARQPVLLELDYMQVKLGFVLLLIVYHGFCHFLFRQIMAERVTWSSDKLRLWNEGATLILVAIVFIIIRKNTVDWLYGIIGLVIFALALMVAIRIYKRVRK